MKVLMSTLKYDSSQIQNKNISNYRYFVTNTNSFDSVSFKSAVSDKDLLRQMLIVAKNDTLKITEGVRKREIHSLIIKIANKLTGKNNNYTDFLIQKYYNELGTLNFIKSNAAFFDRIIAYAEENSVPTGRFKDEIINLLHKTVMPEAYVAEEIKQLTKNSQYMFMINGQKNGKINFLKNPENNKFLKSVYQTMTEQNKSAPVITKTEGAYGKNISKNIVKRTETLDINKSVKTDTYKQVDKQSKFYNTDALMQEYRELCAKQKDPYTLKTDEEKRLWTEQDNRITALYNELRTNNVSFIVKEEYSLDPLVDREAKKAYLYSDKVALASTNEASKLDFLEMYEKYGERYYDPKEPWNSSISIISSSITSNGPTSDTVLRKYINYMDKIAVKDSQGLQDAVIINSVFANNIDSMSEATILKFIEVIKKTSFEQYEGITAKYAVESSSLKDSPKIKAAIDDLTDALKDYPYEVNSDQSVFH